MYHDHNLEGVLLRNVLRRVGLRLWLRWYIPWHQLSSGGRPVLWQAVR
jgi:hypothetical protein